MVLGDTVPGTLGESWAFAASDAHDITGQVQGKNPNARLAVHKASGRLGIAVWIPRSKLGPHPLEDVIHAPVQAHGGAWFIAFRATDPTTGEDLVGEPDSRILDLMDRYNIRRRANQGSWLRAAQHDLALRAERTRLADEEAALESTQRLAVSLLGGHRNTHRAVITRDVPGDAA